MSGMRSRSPSIDRASSQSMAARSAERFADSIIPSNMPGYIAPDLGLKPTGDPDAAKKLLEGKSVPPLHFVISDDVRRRAPRKPTRSRPTSRRSASRSSSSLALPTTCSAIVDNDDAPELSFGAAGVSTGRRAASVVVPVFGPNDDGTTWGSNNALQVLRSEVLRSTAGAEVVVRRPGRDRQEVHRDCERNPDDGLAGPADDPVRTTRRSSART